MGSYKIFEEYCLKTVTPIEGGGLLFPPVKELLRIWISGTSPKTPLNWITHLYFPFPLLCLKT